MTRSEQGLPELLQLLHALGPASAIETPGLESSRAHVVVVEAPAETALRAAGGALVALSGPPRQRRRAARVLRAGGLVTRGLVVARPTNGPVRLLLPAAGAPAAYAATRLRPTPQQWQRTAGAALRWAAVGHAVAATSRAYTLLGDSQTNDRLEWLGFAIDPPRRRDVLALRRAGGDRRLLVFGERADAPAASVVVRPEAAAASRVRAAPETAHAAGAAVPRVLARRAIGAHDVAVETGVRGTPAVVLLAGRPDLLRPVVGDVARWLGRWNGESSRAVTLSRDRIERELLEPARAVAAAGDEAVTMLAGELEGSETREVDVHGDLTMWNVLRDGPGRLGVVDWESAHRSSLPLADLFYAVADARAAVDRYADRVEAFVDCFSAGGALAGDVEALVGAAAKELAISPLVVAAAFRSCWFGHARNEVARGAPGPFEQIATLLRRDVLDLTPCVRS